jgi:hypothetical protein
MRAQYHIVANRGFIVDKGQLDSPVMRQVERPPLGIVITGFGELEIAGLREVALADAEAQVFEWIDAVAEGELPAEVE